MEPNTAWQRFSRAVENTPSGVRLRFTDVVNLSDSVGISLCEAAHVLDTLVARGSWQREFLDGHGNPVAHELVAAELSGYRLGGRKDYQVAWRRGGRGCGYLLA